MYGRSRTTRRSNLSRRPSRRSAPIRNPRRLIRNSLAPLNRRTFQTRRVRVRTHV